MNFSFPPLSFTTPFPPHPHDAGSQARNQKRKNCSASEEQAMPSLASTNSLIFTSPACSDLHQLLLDEDALPPEEKKVK